MGDASFAGARAVVGIPGRRTGLWLVAAMAGLMAVAGPSQTSWAQSSDNQEEEEYGEGLEPFSADGPIMAVISTGSQQIRVWDRNGLVAEARVSTGRKGYDTPEGMFSIIQRKVEHYSNLYDDAEMPFMQRITWSGVALHEGQVPRYRASHGCIRLPNGFAERLFRTTKIATRVVIVPHDARPLPISHPALLQPGSGIPQTQAAHHLADPSSTPDAHFGAPMRLGAGHPSNLTTGALPDTPLPTLRELRQQREETKRKVGEVTQELRRFWQEVRPGRSARVKADRAHRRAEAALQRAEKSARDAEARFYQARNAEQQEAAFQRHMDALRELALARGWEAEAREGAAQIAGRALSAQDAIKELTARRQDLINKSRSLWRRTQPVTVLISRSEGRLYVRRAFHPVIDMPITIRDADQPIGTHIFTAFETDADTLAWTGMTLEMPGGGSPLKASAKAPPLPVRPGQEASKSGKARRETSDDGPLAAARAALDRIEIPAEAMRKILPSLQPGSTIMVSDRGPSIETGPGTDIVVLTKGEEAAREFIARFQAQKKAERIADSGGDPRRRRSGRSGDWQRW